MQDMLKKTSVPQWLCLYTLGLLNKSVMQFFGQYIELKLSQKNMQDMSKKHLCHNNLVCASYIYLTKWLRNSGMN